MARWPKLVRTGVPQRLRDRGFAPTLLLVEGEALQDWLGQRLRGEVEEFLTCPGLEELGDVLEVIQSLALAHGVTLGQLEQSRAAKVLQKGAFITVIEGSDPLRYEGVVIAEVVDPEPALTQDRIVYGASFQDAKTGARIAPLTVKAATPKLVFLDTETTGLSPNRHEVIEIAIITTSADGREVEEAWVTKIAPKYPERAEPEALKVNGYTAEAWRDAPALEQVLAEIARRLQDRVVIGHNVAFDRGFVQAFLPGAIGETRCTRDLARKKVKLASYKLNVLCPHFGITNDGAHSALPDAERCRQLFLKLTA